MAYIGISIADAFVPQTIGNVQLANVSQAKCIYYSFSF